MSDTTYTIRVGAVKSKIVEEIPRDVLRAVDKKTSYKLPDAWTRPHWDDRVHLFSKRTRIFPSGLLKRVRKVLKTFGDVRIVDKRPKYKPSIDEVNSLINDFKTNLRDYQIESIIEGIRRPYGLFWHPTGSGKTILFSALTKCYNVNALVLTHRQELLFQHQETMSNLLDEEVGIIGCGKFEPKRVTIGIINSLLSGLNSERNKKFLESVGYLILDECHHLGSQTWVKLSELCTNTCARHGFSGTCFRSDNADLYLLANTGDVISQYTISYMIENGWLSRPNIYIPKIDEMLYGNDWHVVEKELIQNNQTRNYMACEFINKQCEAGKQVLAMVRLVQHGDIIRDMLINEFNFEQQDIRFMNGTRAKEARKDALVDFRGNAYSVLIGTSIYNEGVDLPTIGAAVNLAGGDSEIATTQRLGRAIRKTRKEGEIDIDPEIEQQIDYMDFNDYGHKFLRRHSKNRIKFYESEASFNVIHGEYGDGSK